MPIRHLVFALAVAAVASTGCDRGLRLATPSEIGQTIITDVLTGTVAAPLNNVRQTTTRTFTVGQGGGPVSISLTSAVLTRPDGTVLTTVLMGLGAGTLDSGGICVIPSDSLVATPAGAGPHLSGTFLPAGTYCVQVSDVTTQVGPVAFSITIVHT